MIVYLDRNVFSHLRRRTRGASAKDDATLRAAIRRGHLSLVLSVVTLSETLLIANWTQALNEARWIIGFTGDTHVVKDVVPLINESVRAYAEGGPPPSPYTTELDLAHIMSPVLRDHVGLRRAAAQYRQQRAAFAGNWTRFLDRQRAEAPRRLTFPEYASRYAGEWLEILAERAGVLDKCVQRGFHGLLDLKTIRLGVVVPLALAHAKVFGDRELEKAHFGDLHHVASATPANVFVTHDPALRELLHRAHVPDLEVLKLPQLLQRLSSVKSGLG